jgi:hypothetical protein
LPTNAEEVTRGAGLATRFKVKLLKESRFSELAAKSLTFYRPGDSGGLD